MEALKNALEKSRREQPVTMSTRVKILRQGGFYEELGRGIVDLTDLPKWNTSSKKPMS